MRPAICAASTINRAPTSSAISRYFAKSIILGYAFALVVSIVQPRLYRAESKIYVSGMCPHGILVGEPRQMISFGHVSVGTTSCAECSMGAESGGNAATK